MGKFAHVIHMFIDQNKLTHAILEAARFGEYDLLKQLLDDGVPVDDTIKDGVTPLMLSSNSGKLRCIDLLLKHGANVNKVGGQHLRSPLLSSLAMAHSCKVYQSMIKKLLNAGADPNQRDSKGMTALDWARKRECPEVIALLSEAMQQ